MEVADQWRREWAGTAEYGNVVEGGVTRRVARAMEVLHASGPGSKMRVMRAAYHASAAPGLPASSYMMHASRRVFSSGFNFLEQPPSLPIRPLEISSTPLESSPEPHTDTENYKVTEPDDFEISEPSKWINAKSGDSLRMPSEESSSADNASIIDLDPRTSHKNIFRKYSYDSENSDTNNYNGRNSRVSPLLDAPVTLSTLKFKSLLNGSNDWNSRRKSYSFEDTSPLTESILQSNDTLAMESSTDSGICKSTEIVNDHLDDNSSKYFESKVKDKHDDSFQSWLSKNRQNNSFYKGPKYKSSREHEVVTEDPGENNITLQSTGKVSITLPIKVETDDGYHYQKNYIGEDGQRKVKKVEFCKTELHFTVDTGKVNIIATDEKPPPTNDFRKRRSAFVPMHEIDDSPITSYGENINFPDINQRIDSLKNAFNELNNYDENTAATKSILKNRIPKPKPYLLGENMAFGSEDNMISKYGDDMSPVLTAVSLINRQLQSENRSDKERTTGFLRSDAVIIKNDAFAANNQGPPTSKKDDTYGFNGVKSQKVVKIHEEQNVVSSVKNLRHIKRSPTPGRVKTRELRDSDLTYFGIEPEKKSLRSIQPNRRVSLDEHTQDVFESVKLIQQFSNSVCNSESEDIPEYINIPIDKTYAPVPTPRIRSKFDDKPNQIDEIKVFKPIIEQVQQMNNNDSITRRSRFRARQDEFSVGHGSRSLSEPRRSYDSIEKPHRRNINQQRCLREQTIREDVDVRTNNTPKTKANKERMSAAVSEDKCPIYTNLNKLDERNISGHITKSDSNSRKKSAQQETQDKRIPTAHRGRKLETPNSSLGRSTADKIGSKRPIKHIEDKAIVEQNNYQKKTSPQRSDKIDKTLSSQTSARKSNRDLYDTKKNGTTENKNSNSHYHIDKNKTEHRSRSAQRQSHKDDAKENVTKNITTRNKKETLEKTSASRTESNNDTNYRKRHSSKDKISETRPETVKVIPKIENSTVDKSTVSRDAKLKNNSKTRKSEYVIKYDDKNGTVSSVSKVRTGSSSPRRKKTTKEVVKEKFRENLKPKSSDKAALLQPDDHQGIVDRDNRKRKRKSKVHNIQRSCQVL